MVVDQAGTKVRECDLSMFTGPTNRRRRQSATDCDRRPPSGSAIVMLGAVRSSCFYRRHHRHAGAEQYVGRFVKEDLHRHALNDFDEIAGRVLRRQQTEGGAGAGLNGVDVAGEVPRSGRRRSRDPPAARVASA